MITGGEIRAHQRERLGRFIREHGDYFRDKHVLDFGCGTMPYRFIVEAAGGDYTGYNRGRFPGGSHEDIGPEDPLARTWDVILCTQMLQYVKDPQGLLDAFHHALRFNGVLVLTYATNWPEVEPEDLHRFTRTGMEHLLQAWRGILVHDTLLTLPFGDVERLPLGGGLIAVA